MNFTCVYCVWFKIAFSSLYKEAGLAFSGEEKVLE